nr:MAG TPA: hypothetical protein [Caudoviricetes sp.]
MYISKYLYISINVFPCLHVSILVYCTNVLNAIEYFSRVFQA